MGLIKCLDCRKKFSDRIEHCPKCGCPKSEIIKEQSIKTKVVDNELENAEKTEEPLKRKKVRSSKKSISIIAILLVLSYMNFLHPYLVDSYLNKYAFLLGWIDFIIFSIIMMVIPFIYGMVKKKCTIKDINRISFINSLLLFVASIIYSEVNGVLYVGLLGVIMYYFINKHTLILMHLLSKNKNYQRNASSIFIIIILSILILLF